MIIHIGRFHLQKNHMFLIDVFSEILKMEPFAKLLLVGDGSLRDEISRRISDKNMSKHIIVAGIRSDVPELLQAADILVFPSLFEGLPGVVLESQAAGLPCVISDSITSEVKVTDLVRFVSLNNDALFWAKEILRVQRNFERRNTTNEIINKGFDVEIVAKWYENFYINQIEQNNGIK